MKHHKQLRWLLFLLIPLIILFALHLFIPLIIKKTNHSLSQQNYKYDLVSAQKTSIISNHFSNFRTVSFAMAVYFNQLLALLDLYNQQPTAFLNTTINSIYNINAYQFAKEIESSSSPKSTELNGSMWFSTGADATSQLSSNQLDLLERYLSVEPFIKTMVFTRRERLVSSVCLYIVRDNESIYAQYPIQYKAQFLNISADTVDDIFMQTVQTSQLNNYETAASFYEFDQSLNRTLLVLCRPSFQSNASIVVCLKLRLSALGNDLSQQIRVGQGLYFSSAMQLILSNDILHSTNKNPQILLQFDDPEMNSFIIPKNAYFDIARSGLDPIVFNSVVNLLNRRLYVLQQNQTIWYLSPIRDVNNRSAVLHLVTKSEIGSAELLPEGFKSNLNLIIIPVSLLAIVFTLINCFIMKKLLESVDKQLFELDERCKFIADGDINVDIPKYYKSKDMKEIYTRVNIISKLHRYCDNSYFSGHFSDKILKYNEALQLIRSLGYDPGNLLENIGEAYNYLNEWSHSTKYLKQSVETIMFEIEKEYGPMDGILSHKLRKSCLPLKYREMQLVLIRRLFKLNYAYIRYFEMSQGNLNEDINLKLKGRLQKKRQKYSYQFTQYIDLFKKAIYPNIAKFAQGIIILFFELKHILQTNKSTEVRMQERKAIELLQIYKNNYARISRLLKQRKGSSHKLFFLSNKLTDYSRSNPSLLMTIQNLIRAKVEQACNPLSSNYIHKFQYLTEALTTPIFFIGTSYLVMKQIRKLLVNLKVDVQSLQTTKLFKQNIPFKTLYTDEIMEEKETHLLRMATKQSKGLQKQFVLMFDCERNLGKEQKEEIDGCEYFHHEADHLFTKLVKACDRVSIIKFNTKEGIKIECGLVLKEANETVLKNEIDEAISERNTEKNIQNYLLEAVEKAICRIKHLCCQKVIVMFFRNISHYILHSEKSRRKRRSTKRSSIKSMVSSEGKQLEFDDFGDYLVNWLQDENIHNLIFVLYCAKGDSIEKFRDYFGLIDINRRILASTSGLNRHNKSVFIIQQKHKTDVDRILMLKALDIPDNNVFVL